MWRTALPSTTMHDGKQRLEEVSGTGKLYYLLSPRLGHSGFPFDHFVNLVRFPKNPVLWVRPFQGSIRPNSELS